MGFRPVSQRLRDINLQALGKFSCLALVLGLESVSHPAGPIQAPSFSQGTASPSFATPLGLDGPARARAEMWNVGLSGAVSVRDELRWVF
ncbi:TPA: mucoid induction factor MucE [Pseudomonas aeruginosa]|nr:mucoid induction factor MucE [Pseudomonas aeruginosa]HBN9960920.1 mucoid induction factor MucE [Pseudomonas aeruginosa]